MGRRFAVAGALALVAAGCGGGGTTAPVEHGANGAPKRIQLLSPAFASSSRIPARYTCAGKDISPPLRWTQPPSKTKALVLLMIDLNAPGGPFTHWALADIPPATRGIPAGGIPPGAVAGRNGFGKIGYGGPCPPAGKPHHYVIELLALPRRVTVSRGFASGALGHQPPLAAGELRGTFSRG
jgi:Raf kinase inhibitor-like YbhB/YbcL family protein